jgi:hypothetical protein
VSFLARGCCLRRNFDGQGATARRGAAIVSECCDGRESASRRSSGEAGCSRVLEQPILLKCRISTSIMFADRVSGGAADLQNAHAARPISGELVHRQCVIQLVEDGREEDW